MNQPSRKAAHIAEPGSPTALCGRSVDWSAPVHKSQRICRVCLRGCRARNVGWSAQWDQDGWLIRPFVSSTANSSAFTYTIKWTGSYAA